MVKQQFAFGTHVAIDQKVAPDQSESGQSTFISDGVVPSARVLQTSPWPSVAGESLPMGRDCRYELFSGTGPAAFAEDFSVAPWSRQSVWRRGSPLRAPKLVATDVNVARIQEATANFDATAVGDDGDGQM